MTIPVSVNLGFLDPVEYAEQFIGHGLAGAADAFLVLKRANSASTLIGRGRDTEDIDLAHSIRPGQLPMDAPGLGRWQGVTMGGDPVTAVTSSESCLRQALFSPGK